MTGGRLVYKQYHPPFRRRVHGGCPCCERVALESHRSHGSHRFSFLFGDGIHSSMPRYSPVTPSIYARYMLDICPVLVRYSTEYIPSIYRTYTGQVPDKYIACNMVSSWLHLGFNSPAVSSLSVQGKSGILHVAGGLVVLNIKKKIIKKFGGLVNNPYICKQKSVIWAFYVLSLPTK